MRLLASFCNTGKIGAALAIIDPCYHKLYMVSNTWDQAFGCTGIARTPFGYAIGCQLAGGGAGIELRDHWLRIISRYRCKHIQDIHSLVWHKHFLYAVSSGNNSIYMLRLLDGWVQLEELYTCLWNTNYDAMHVNSIAVLSDWLVVSHFGGRTMDQMWQGVRNGCLVKLWGNEVLAENLEHPHSLIPNADELWYCESCKGSVTRIKTSELDGEKEIVLGGYTRGLALTEHLAFVGISESRHLSRSTGVLNDAIDDPQLASIRILSRQSLEPIDRFIVSDRAKEIYDLVVL